MLNKKTINVGDKTVTLMQYPFADSIRISCKLVPFIGLVKSVLNNTGSINELLDTDLSAINVDGLLNELTKIVADEEGILSLIKKILSYVICNDTFLSDDKIINDIFGGDLLTVFKIIFESLKFNLGGANFFTQKATTEEVVIAKETAHKTNEEVVIAKETARKKNT